jgi:2-hydroxycyclohexanecarboxyl-CoA dehydrogenase
LTLLYHCSIVREDASVNDIGCALVTGAAGAIGAAIAGRLNENGWSVVATDVSFSGDSRLDVTDHRAVAEAVDRIEREVGAIDVLVNNAGIDVPARFVDSTPQEWARMIAVNLHGVLNCTHAVVPRMVARGHGAIVQVASEAGRVGSPAESVYSATKGAVIAFSRALAKEVGPAGVRVNCVCPGPVDTAMLDRFETAKPGVTEAMRRATPLGRVATPADVADAVTYLAGTGSAFITGQCLGVSGGIVTI